MPPEPADAAPGSLVSELSSGECVASLLSQSLQCAGQQSGQGRGLQTVDGSG